MTLREFLIEQGKRVGLEGTDESYIKFFKMIMNNNFNINEQCVKEIMENE